MSYIILPFGFVTKEKKIKHDLPKNYGASQHIKMLPYISKEDLNFQNSIIDTVNNRSDLKIFLLATSNGGNYVDGQNNNKKINELPIPELT